MVTAHSSAINELVAMGFSLPQAREALEKNNNNKEQAINWIFSHGESDYIAGDSHEHLGKDISISMLDSSAPVFSSFDPISPEDRVREASVPVGLKNVGNTCYFNSLLQAYFMIPDFVKEILSFQEPKFDSDDATQQTRLQRASLKLVKQLQRLFCAMTRSHRRYVDPSNVLNALVDDFGNQLMIGDQKDVGEFNMVFVSRVEDGMKPVKPDDAQEEEAKIRPDDCLNEAQLKPEDSQREDSVGLDDSQGEASAKPDDDRIEAQIKPDDEQEYSDKSDPSIPQTQLVRKGSLNYSISAPDDGVISSLFYGRQVELLTSSEADGSRVFQHQEALFGQVMLDVNERDIYSAWNKACFSNIEGYLTPKGFPTSAQQEIWITRLPKVMLFQIQRVCYDSESKSSIKKHSVFNIDKVLHPDRFMHQNRGLTVSLMKQVHQLKAEAATLESTLGMYERFASENLSLEKVLMNASAFIGEQMDQHRPQTNDFQSDNVTQAELALTQRILDSYQEQVCAKVNSMRSKLTALQAAINAVFDLEELKQIAYNLHSILVHDGMANSGHYYSYIYDSDHDLWRKYSDTSVTEVSEQEVFERSIGGYSMTSAYCLMYVEASLSPRDPGEVHRSYSINEDPAVLPDIYSRMLPADLKREVDDDNIKLRRELEDYKSNQVIRLIQDTYVSRFMTVSSQSMCFRSLPALSTEGCRFSLINLVVYLKIKYEERLVRYQLLDTVCREVLHQPIAEMDKSGPLYQRLVNKLLKSHKDMPYTLELMPTDLQRLGNLTQEFRTCVLDASYNVVLFKALLNEDFPQTYAILRAELKRNPTDSTAFKRVPREVSRIGAYFLMTAVSANLFAGNLEKALEFASILVPWVIDFSNNYDILYKQVAMSFRRVNRTVEQTDSPLKDDFEMLYRALETLCFDRIEVELPQEYNEVQHTVDSMDLLQWIEGWKTDSLATHYNNLILAYKVKFSKWHDLSTKLLTLRRLLTERELQEFEERTASVHLT